MHVPGHVTKHLRYALASVFRDASVPRVQFFIITSAYHPMSVQRVLQTKCTGIAAAHAHRHVTKLLGYVQLSVLRDASVVRVRFFIMTNVYHLVSVPLFSSVPLVKYTRNVVALAQLHVIKHLGDALFSVSRVVSVQMV